VLVCAFLGWLYAGMHMSITQLAGQSAAIHLLDRTGRLDAVRYSELGRKSPKQRADKSQPSTLTESEQAQYRQWKTLTARWFAWYQCSFLFGAAAGGFLFGRLGDRIGRSKAMALSILTYSIMAGASYFASSPEYLLICWFLACTGVGGMWPNGVALVSEAWAGMSRPMVAGLIGTAANIGIFLFSSLARQKQFEITHQTWQWVMLAGAHPIWLGLLSLLAVPESPRWLAERASHAEASKVSASKNEIFRPPLLSITLLGILLATIPIIGGWGTANWMVPWAEDYGIDSLLKARVNQARSLTGMIASLLGGWIASLCGRRLTYAVVSAACLFIAQYTFWYVIPTDASFLYWVAALGFFSGIYFGWLPLFLPELFPTRVRSTGAGVSFNFGRIAAAMLVLTAGSVMTFFEGDFARIGRLTSLFFAPGIVAVFLAPDTARKDLE
jgi:MFS family permease